MSIELVVDQLAGKRPERTIAFLHGVLGRGNNLRTIAQRFIEARPEWSAWLVDLRGHGRSPKGTAAPSLEAAARDVVDLAGRASQPLAAIVGHSFGGKVALEALRLEGIRSLEDVVVIDSAPGAGGVVDSDDSVLSVIEMIESLPPRFASRRDFIEAV